MNRPGLFALEECSRLVCDAIGVGYWEAWETFGPEAAEASRGHPADRPGSPGASVQSAAIPQSLAPEVLSTVYAGWAPETPDSAWVLHPARPEMMTNPAPRVPAGLRMIREQCHSGCNATDPTIKCHATRDLVPCVRIARRFQSHFEIVLCGC